MTVTAQTAQRELKSARSKTINIEKELEDVKNITFKRKSNQGSQC